MIAVYGFGAFEVNVWDNNLGGGGEQNQMCQQWNNDSSWALPKRQVHS